MASADGAGRRREQVTGQQIDRPASPAPAGQMLVSWASSHDDPGTTWDMQPQFTDLPIGSPLPCRDGPRPHRAVAVTNLNGRPVNDP